MIPVTLLTGFLGAGKTTLLNRLLLDPELADAAVLINEFGDIAIDHLLVERIDEGIVLLGGGCICCAVRGDLVDALDRLLQRRDAGTIAPFRRVLLETTGLADPIPLVQTIILHPRLCDSLVLDGVVTVVDAANGLLTVSERPEARRQIAVADRLVISKRDLAPESAELIAELDSLAPGVSRFDARTVAASDLLDAGPWSPVGRLPDIADWLRAEAVSLARPQRGSRDPNRHGSSVRAFALTTPKAIPPGHFEMFLDLVRGEHGPRLLRLKGLVKLSDDAERPVVIHGVRHSLSSPIRLARWPDGERLSRLVFIVDGIASETIERLFAAFLGEPRLDAPDAAALFDNPLAFPGGR